MSEYVSEWVSEYVSESRRSIRLGSCVCVCQWEELPLLADSIRLGSCGCVFSSLTALP